MVIKKYIGFDLGASSGRAVLGILEDEKLTMEEIYRFPNSGIRIFDSIYWDILGLYQNILNALKTYVNKYGKEVDGIGIDTWGVDYVLLDEKDEIIAPIHHYRDGRTEGVFNEIFKLVSKEEIFQQTGIQFLSLNTIYQLYSMIKSDSSRLKITKTMLMLPDFFNFLLSGVKKSEFSDVSTSQLYNPIKKTWAFDLIKKLGFEEEWFGEIISPGNVLGNVQGYVCKETGIDPKTKIIAPASHDTASAVAAVPVDMETYKRGEWAYLSSGTWSLLGVELDKPLINEKALNYNFTNEGGIDNTIRFLKNISGLWLIQEAKKIWDVEHGEHNWDDIMKMAEAAQRFRFFIYPDDPSFLNPLNMIEAIEHYCEKASQGIPRTIGDIARAVFESLAFRYKQVIGYLEEILGNKIKILYIIGGGSRNILLNQFVSNVLNIPVKAGPAEATVIGNILVQAKALGDIKSIEHLRSIVRNCFSINTFLPKDTVKWENAYSQYLECCFE